MRLGCNVVCSHSRKLRFKGFGLIHWSHTKTQTIKTTEAVVDRQSSVWRGKIKISVEGVWRLWRKQFNGFSFPIGRSCLMTRWGNDDLLTQHTHQGPRRQTCDEYASKSDSVGDVSEILYWLHWEDGSPLRKKSLLNCSDTTAFCCLLLTMETLLNNIWTHQP